MVKMQTQSSSIWAISWQAALIPDPTMIPTEDIFLLDSPIQPIVSNTSLTATIASIPGLLFQTPEMLLCGIPNTQPRPVQKLARMRTTKSRKKSQQVSTTK